MARVRYALLCSVFGILAGPLIDGINLRTALLIGTVPSFIGRLGSALTVSRWWVTFYGIIALPLGAAFGLPVFALGVRRFTHPENRGFAFTLFYSVLCASSAAGGFLISFCRHRFPNGLDVPRWVNSAGHLDWMRIVVVLCSMCSLYTCLASCFVRNERVQQDVPLERARLVPPPATRPSVRDVLRVVYRSRPFWKLLLVSLVVSIGTRGTFRHLDATFPKYFTRMYGPDAPFEWFVAVEPVVTVLLSFPVTYLLLRHRTGTWTTLMRGTLLQVCN